MERPQNEATKYPLGLIVLLPRHISQRLSAATNRRRKWIALHAGHKIVDGDEHLRGHSHAEVDAGTGMGGVRMIGRFSSDAAIREKKRAMRKWRKAYKEARARGEYPTGTHPNSVGADNLGAVPELANLPLTPEQEAEAGEILRQMSDPSTELGSYGVAELMSKENPQD